MSISSIELKQFLQEGYAFRRNLLSGKIEYRELNVEHAGNDGCEQNEGEAAAQEWRPFTIEDLNSVTLAAE